MANWTLKFVDKIDAAPNVRLDVNDKQHYLALADGCDFSPPEMRRSQSSTLIDDGSPIDASAFGNRLVHLKLTVKGTGADDLSTKLRALMFELNRERNILMLQRSSTPVFFRTYRSPDATLDISDDGMNRATVECPIMAEPFAYGLVQTLSGTVNNDPANATNPMSLVFGDTAVLGDVDTPAQIKFTAPSASVSWLAIRYGSTAPSLLFAQAEAGTAGTDTTIPANDAAMSGTGSNYTRTTFAGITSLADRVTGIPVGATGTAIRGTYRAYLRVRKTTPGDVNTARLSLTVAPGFVLVAGPSVTVPVTSGNGPYWMDMGLFQIPVGADPQVDGYSGVALPVAAVQAKIALGRTSGVGSLDADVILFVPADDASTSVTNLNDTVLDGPQDAAYDVSGGNMTSRPVSRVGSIPDLRPGFYNQLVFMRTVGTGPSGADSKTATTALTVNYWPRYLTV